jgi:hypothetical protein
MRPITSFCLILLFIIPACAADGPRIFIVTDLEGVGGVNSAEEQLLPGQRRYDESRRLLAGEVNAAVEGVLKGGASEVVIWDGHDGSRTCLSMISIITPDSSRESLRQPTTTWKTSGLTGYCS